MAETIRTGIINLERSAVTGAFTAQYPEARATKEEERRAGNGSDYSLFGIHEPLKVANESHEKISSQMAAYLRVCESLAQKYHTDNHVKRLIHAGFLQFESPVIKDLVEKYPTTSMTGARFASDIVVSGDEEGADVKLKRPFQSVEVNCGPVGGLSETAEAQGQFPETQFPLSDELLYDHVNHATTAYYDHASKALGKEPKPAAQRKVVYVENDGWYPGSVVMAEQLKKRGMDIEIAPREALKLDRDRNVLKLERADGTNTDVDQLFLYFHLQADVKKEKGKEDKPGEVIEALQTGAVVAETSMLPVIVLGAKVTTGIVGHLIENPDGALRQRLGITAEDVTTLKDMFPSTDQWRADYFRKGEHGVNGLMLREWLKEGKVVAKVTNDGLYGGRGVFTFNQGSRQSKEVQSFTNHLQDEVTDKLLAETDASHLLRKLRDKKTETDLVDYFAISKNNPKFAESANARRLAYMIEALHGSINLDDLQRFRLTEQDHARIVAVTDKFREANFKDKAEVADFFRNLAALYVKVGLNVDNEKSVDDMQRRLTEYLSTRMVMPLIIQDKIEDPSKMEYRLAGSIGKGADDHTGFLSAMRPPTIDKPFKSMHPVTLETIDPPFKSRTEDQLNPVLEIEAEAPEPSTAIELSMIPQDRKFEDAMVLMCGTGRHARMLSPFAERVHGIDLSTECIEEAQKRNTGIENIGYRVGDVRKVLAADAEAGKNYDLITVAGNSISYLEPDQQRALITQVGEVIAPGGIFTYDVTDIPKYQAQLDQNGPTSVRTEQPEIEEGNTVQRVINREIEVVEEPDRFAAINEKLRYVIGNSRERVHEIMTYYMASQEETVKMLTEAGFRNIKFAPIFDPYYASMMRNRWIVSAEK